MDVREVLARELYQPDWRDWETQPEALKDEYRATADNILAALDAAGFAVAPNTTKTFEPSSQSGGWQLVHQGSSPAPGWLTERLRVEGGWLYCRSIVGLKIAEMCFVPDPEG